MEVSSQRVLLTGGAGFIGVNLTRALLASGLEVAILDDFSNGFRENLVTEDSFQVYEGSILDQNLVNKCVASSDFIVHLAARGSVPRSIKDPIGTFQSNVVGTMNILESCRKNMKPLIYSSSSSVYGRNEEMPKEENMWTSPMTPYAASKLSAESLVSSYARTYGFKVAIFRFFNVFGPYQMPNHPYAAVIPKWVWQALKSQPIDVYGDLSKSRDFTYVKDVVQVLVNVIRNDFSHETPINLAFGSRITLDSVVKELKETFPRLTQIQHPEREGDIPHSQNDPKLFTSLFPNAKPSSFKKALNETILWIMNNEEKIERLTRNIQK